MMEKPVKCGCGGEAIIVAEPRDGYTTYYCTCLDCAINTDYQASEAVAAWDRAMGERTVKATRNPQAFFYHCECGYALCCEKNDMNYCPNCSARLEWDE